MPHLVYTHVRARAHLLVYPRGLVGGCPPPRSAGGVIASAQIEYISYVFITTARYVVPLSAAYPLSAARTPRRHRPPEEGWPPTRGGRSEEGKRRTRGAPERNARERDAAGRGRGGGKKGRRRDCGYEGAGEGKRASTRGWPREIKREEIPVD